MSLASNRFLLLTCSRLVLACLWLLLAVGALAPHVSAQYQFDVWTTNNGLPDNTVNSVVQTRDGYLWFTTYDGLVRYDGARFTVFNSSQMPGLKSNRFIRVMEDRAGNLWATTERSELVKYRAGIFTTYSLREYRVHRLEDLLREEPDGSLLISTNSGLARWKDGDYRSLPEQQEGSLVEFGFPVAGGAVWHLHQDVLQRTIHGQVTASVAAQGLSNERLLALYEDRQGALWVWAAQGELRKFKDGRWTVYPAAHLLPPLETGRTIGHPRVMHEDRQGKLWLGMLWGQLLCYRDGQLVAQPLPADFDPSLIAAICEDREGSLWLGTHGGLVRLRKPVVTTYTVDNGLTNNTIRTIYQDRRGRIWIGARVGLTTYENGVFTPYSQPGNPMRGHITALTEDRDGALWVAYIGGLLWRIRDGQTDSFAKSDYGIMRSSVRAMLADRQGRLWLGTREGVSRYEAQKFTIFTRQDGLAGDDIAAIIEDRHGAIWIGSDGGLTSYLDGRFRSYTQADGLPGRPIWALYEDEDGVLWIGTADGGLSRMQNGRFTNYTTRQGLFSNGVFQILEDGQDNLWMSCRLGIYRVSKRQLNDYAAGQIKSVTSVGYGTWDGMRNTVCNGGDQPSGIKARDGKLWFPTQGGVAVLDPTAAAVNQEPPPVMIEEFRLRREPVALGAEMRVPAGQDDFEIQYTALSFIKPEQVRFRYQLAGLDDEWIEVGARRVAYFSHVPPGDYLFKVIAANSDGVWNMAGASLRVTVVPPFWRRWWFVALVAASGTGLLLLGYRRRVAQLESERAAQEAFSRQLIASEERERKRVAAELHDSLGQRLILVKNMLLMHLRTPGANGAPQEQLDEVSSEVSQAIAEVKEISYNLRPHQLDQLGLSKALKALLKRVSDSSGIAFNAEVEDVDGLLSPEAEISLYRIVQEGINNIVKHSGATAARVTLVRDDSGLRLEIRDNGRGFAPDATTSGRGFGLIGIVERARLLGGRPQIQSAPGAGTTITIEMEMRNGHATKPN
jgi:signal transduction histidine kinase/ligand-binding sensor domain-containing protein